MLSNRAILWLEARGLDPEVAARLGVESCEKGGHEILAFPYFQGKTRVNTKYRLLDEKRFWMDEGGILTFWNFNVLQDESLLDQPLIITEGEIDALTVIQCGFPNCVSVPNGAPASENESGARYEWLTGLEPMLRDRQLILAVDDDAAGHRLRKDIEIQVGAARCRWVRFPDDCKDMNDVLQAFGASTVVELIAGAPWGILDGLYALNDLPPEPDREVYSTGFDGLDPHFKIRRGEMTVVSGVPNGGKTAFVCDLACRIADRWGWRVALGSFEDNPRQTLVRRLQKWKIGRPLDQASDDERESAEAWVSQHFCFIVPVPEEDTHLFWLMHCMKAAVVRYGAKMIIVDPWNELEHDKPDGASLTEYVGEAIRALKQFAKNYDIHLIIVTHPTKAVGWREDSSKIMSLYDISDSAHWVNKPDAGIIVHRNDEHGLTAVSVKKIRFQEDIGRPGTVWYSFNSYRGRFEVAAAPEELERPNGRRKKGNQPLL